MYMKRSTLSGIISSSAKRDGTSVENATTDLVKIFRIKRKIKSKLSNRLKFISRKDELIVLGLLMASGSRAHIQSQYIVCVLAGKSNFNGGQF